MSKKSTTRKIIETPASSSDITLAQELQPFFFEQLDQINKKSSSVVANEFIFYLSWILEHYAAGSAFFEAVDGKLEDKILGVKLLSLGQMAKTEQIKTLKDVGDTSLVLCGVFGASLEKKLISESYYHQLGRTAFTRLDALCPEWFNVPSFYRLVANQFEKLILLLRLAAKNFMAHDREHILWVCA